MKDLVNTAAATLQARAEIARQILEDLSHIDQIIAKDKFNDDDWYEFNCDTLQFVRHYSGKNYRFAPSVMVGHTVARGMRAKHLGLWK